MAWSTCILVLTTLAMVSLSVQLITSCLDSKWQLYCQRPWTVTTADRELRPLTPSVRPEEQRNNTTKSKETLNATPPCVPPVSPASAKVSQARPEPAAVITASTTVRPALHPEADAMVVQHNIVVKGNVTGFSRGTQEFEVVYKTEHFTCYMPRRDGDEPLCHPPKTLILYGDTKRDEGYLQFVTELEETRYHLSTPKQNMPFRKKCLFEQPFPPLITAYDPPYKVCTLMHTVNGGEPDERLTWYYPFDSEDSQVDCNVLPFLMELSIGNTNTTGVAADIGASYGNCAFTLLSRGHIVHLFDYRLATAKSYERALVSMTLNMNNWTQTAHMHGGVSANSSLHDALGIYPTVHLVKIDVDGIGEIKPMLWSGTRTFAHTNCVEVEMPTDEVTLREKYEIGAHFDDLGFEWYSVYDFHEFQEGDPHVWASKAFLSTLIDGGYASSELGRFMHLPFTRYGELRPLAMTMEPLCLCPQKGRSRGNQVRLLQSGQQYAFVRRASDMFARVASQFGACAPCPHRKKNVSQAPR